MSSSFVLFQPLSLRKAVGGWGSYGLGSGVEGLSVLTHMYTLPMILLFILSHRSSSLDECAEGSRTSNFRVLLVVCSSTDKNRAIFPHARPPVSVHSSQGRIFFHAQDFPGFYPRIFPPWIWEWCGSVLYSRADLWVQHCDCSRTGGETIKFIPSMVCVHFP